MTLLIGKFHLRGCC